MLVLFRPLVRHAFIRDRLKNAVRIGDIRKDFEMSFPAVVPRADRNVQHTSPPCEAYHLSGYEEAAVCSWTVSAILSVR
jgi:hypothetical protein